jgi:hypothetical protein
MSELGDNPLALPSGGLGDPSVISGATPEVEILDAVFGCPSSEHFAQSVG